MIAADDSVWRCRNPATQPHVVVFQLATQINAVSMSELGQTRPRHDVRQMSELPTVSRLPLLFTTGRRSARSGGALSLRYYTGRPALRNPSIWMADPPVP